MTAKCTDFSIGVAYGTDLDEAREVAINAVAGAETVHQEPAPEAWVEEFAGSWVNIRVRYWHDPRTADKWVTRNAALIAVYKATEQHGIDMPFERKIVQLEPGPAPLAFESAKNPRPE